jgi:hypothetical protein
MIDDKMLAAIVSNPEQFSFAPDLIAAKYSPALIGLLGYGADVLRAAMHTQQIDPPHTAILSVVISPYEEADIQILARRIPQEVLERRSFSQLLEQLNFITLARAIEALQTDKSLRHFEAVVPCEISAHAMLTLQQRLKANNALIAAEES